MVGVKETPGSPLSFPSPAVPSNHLGKTKMKGCLGGSGYGKGQREGHPLSGWCWWGEGTVTGQGGGFSLWSSGHVNAL